MVNTMLNEILKKEIIAVKDALKRIEGLDDMFEQCFLSTVETTLKKLDGEYFVITGDIPAMWLRDSTCQIMHYLRFLQHEEVKAFVLSVIRTQLNFILYDPYANAFNMENGKSWDPHDYPPKKDRVWERKYEVDSLCYPVMLMRAYYDKTGESTFLDETAHKALRTIVDLFKLEQRHENSEYLFIRKFCPKIDTLANKGKGTPTAYTGMTWSGFRPSDDACTYHYLVPSNFFAKRILQDIALFAEKLSDAALMTDSKTLANEIAKGIQEYACFEDEQYGKVLSYEVDGLGNRLFMDDANVPSLLSLPYLDAVDADDPVYQNTRKMVLSKKNPFYYEGKAASGVGSPHTPKGYIWHIALCMQAMTSKDENEIAQLLDMIITTTAGTGFMHEGFSKDNPHKFTRSWFAWANSLFAELILRLYDSNRLENVLSLLKAEKVS